MNDGNQQASQQPAPVAPSPETLSVVAHAAHTQQARSSEPHDDPVQQSAETGGSGPSSTGMSLARAGSAPSLALPQQQISVTVQHRAKAASLLSPSHFVHIPRQFFHSHFDVSAILKTGINLQLETNGQAQAEIKKVAVASYTNTSGHTYFRLLGFKPMCRQYTGWRIDKWTKVNEDTLRLCISGPHIQVQQDPAEQHQEGHATGAEGVAAGPSSSQGIEGATPDARGSGSSTRGRASRASAAGALATRNSETSGGRAGPATTPKRPADDEDEQKERGGRHRGKIQAQAQPQALTEPGTRSQQQEQQRSQLVDALRMTQGQLATNPQMPQQSPQPQQQWLPQAGQAPSSSATDLLLQQLQQQAAAPRTFTTISSLLGAQGSSAWQQPQPQQQQQQALLGAGISTQPPLSLTPWPTALAPNQQQQQLAQLIAAPQAPQLQLHPVYQPVLQATQLQQPQYQQHPQQQLMMMVPAGAQAVAAQPLPWPMAGMQEAAHMNIGAAGTTAAVAAPVNVASAPQLYVLQAGTGQPAMLVQGAQHVQQATAYSQPVLSGLLPAVQLQQLQQQPQQQVMLGAPLTLMQGVAGVQQLLDMSGQQLQLAAAHQALTAPQQQQVLAGVALQPGGQAVYHLQHPQQPPQH